MKKKRQLIVGSICFVILIIVAVIFYSVGYNNRPPTSPNPVETKTVEPFFHSVQEFSSYYGFSLILPKGWYMGAHADSYPTLESTRNLTPENYIEKLRISYFLEPIATKITNNTSFFEKVDIYISDDKDNSWKLVKVPQTGKLISVKELTVNGLPAIIGESSQEWNSILYRASIALNDNTIVQLSLTHDPKKDSAVVDGFKQIYLSVKKI